mmetsp:Transcript_9364/g.20476  ORF Transcript_9364/g.20476 Transcript_9364/m.20476 type:complete len:221 (+) Transcript_9364:821-1483(+)
MHNETKFGHWATICEKLSSGREDSPIRDKLEKFSPATTDAPNCLLSTICKQLKLGHWRIRPWTPGAVTGPRTQRWRMLGKSPAGWTSGTSSTSPVPSAGAAKLSFWTSNLESSCLTSPNFSSHSSANSHCTPLGSRLRSSNPSKQGRLEMHSFAYRSHLCFWNTFSRTHSHLLTCMSVHPGPKNTSSQLRVKTSLSICVRISEHKIRSFSTSGETSRNPA